MKNLKHLRKRGLAMFLALVMCLGMTTVPVLAEDLQHSADCGYDCQHQHDDNCGAVTYEDSTNPEDGYVAAVEGQEAISCPNGESCTGEEENHVPPVDAVEAKDEIMGKKRVETPENCTHSCVDNEACVWICTEDCPVKSAEEAAKL